MAHVGKVYPLSLRRDFQLNLTNYRFGNAANYLLSWEAVFGTLGDALNGDNIMLNEAGMSPAKELQWISNRFITGTFDAVIRLFAVLDESAQEIRVFLDVIDNPLGTLFRTHQWDRPNTVGQGANYPRDFLPQHETPGIIQQREEPFGDYRAVEWP
jgi:hypothetical protein